MSSKREPSHRSSAEPPTRVLSAGELHARLREAAQPHAWADDALTRPFHGVSLHEPEAATRWMRRPQREAEEPATTLAPRTHAAEQPLTVAALDASALRAAALPRLGTGRIPAPPAAPLAEPGPSLEVDPRTPPGAVAPPRRALPRWAWMAAGLAVVAAAILFVRSPRSARPGVARRATASVAAMAPQPARSAAVATSSTAAPASASGSPRRALDLLLAGQRELALDAYRALAHGRPQQPVYARMAELLEREARACRESGSCP